MKRLLITLLKIGISVALLTYLVHDALGPLETLQAQEKDWGMMALGTLLCFVAVVICNLRWYLLVRALDLPFRMRDAFRLGFLGYMLNFFSLGSVGGDLFKAIFIAREQPGRRAEAVATVVIDRLVGLYALFLVASAAVLITGLASSPVVRIAQISRLTLFGTAIGAVCIALLLIPGFTHGKLSQRLTRIPRVGHILKRLLDSIRIYRRKLWVLVVTGAMSLGVHALSTTGIYLLSRGLPGPDPSLASHFIIVPLAMLAGALPLPLSGLGAMEAVMDYLYQQIPSGVAVAEKSGLFVSFAYRVATILIAIVGFCYYLANRAMVRKVVAESEQAEEGADDATPAASSQADSPDTLVGAK
ncbi:MAG: flippase-like domain-containing protein [Planctomycetia bacterium]|nr:flippase-like domain-containing protein [Planctomycetia bacterium]